jgi:L-alanine-DL-glutamate epimerase-like enolase superfamily enzyme
MTLVAQDGMRIGFPKLIVVFRKRGHPGSRTVDASKQAVAMTNSGLVGWGEGCPFGNAYLPAFAAGIHAGIAELAPLLLGENPLHPEQLSLTMDGLLAGHDYIKSALDMACWDLLGQAAGLPLYALLGGRFSDGVAMMGVCPNDAPEAMAAALR